MSIKCHLLNPLEIGSWTRGLTDSRDKSAEFLSGVLSFILGVYVDSFRELVLCLHPKGHRNTTYRLGGKSLYLLSHFTNSTVFVLLLIFK